MKSLDFNQVSLYVNDNIDAFHSARLKSLSNLNIRRLTSKNPYLYRAKNMVTASDIVKDMMVAFLSSSEEEMFGRFLEDLAIYVCSETLGGHKSTTAGLDLEFVGEDSTYYVVAVKSGTNWGNSSQHAKLVDDFNLATRRLLQSRHTRNVQSVLGICYGRTRTSRMKHGYLKAVGQNFWALVSGNRNLYKQIIEPIGYRAREHNDAYELERSRIENLLTARFLAEYCLPDGNIDWEKLVEASSKNYDLDRVLGFELR